MRVFFSGFPQFARQTNPTRANRSFITHRVFRQKMAAIATFTLAALARIACADARTAGVAAGVRITIITCTTFIEGNATITTLVFRITGASGALASAGVAAAVANTGGFTGEPLTRVLDCTSKHIVTTRRLALGFGQQFIAG